MGNSFTQTMIEPPRPIKNEDYQQLFYVGLAVFSAAMLQAILVPSKNQEANTDFANLEDLIQQAIKNSSRGLRANYLTYTFRREHPSIQKKDINNRLYSMYSRGVLRKSHHSSPIWNLSAD